MADAPKPGTPERLEWLRRELERANMLFMNNRDDVHWVLQGKPGGEQIFIHGSICRPGSSLDRCDDPMAANTPGYQKFDGLLVAERGCTDAQS